MTTTQSQGSAIKGILGKKLGMTQVFDANNKIVPVTVIEAGPTMCRHPNSYRRKRWLHSGSIGIRCR